jgi:hypothetical protein
LLKSTVEDPIRQVRHVGNLYLISIFFQVAKEGQNVKTSHTRGRTEEAAGGGRRVQTLQTLKALMADFARRTPTGINPDKIPNKAQLNTVLQLICEA